MNETLTGKVVRLKRRKRFANGIVYALETHDGYPVEVTDTFLPTYTKDAIGRKQNALTDGDLGDRSQRWMVGVSVMSGCPVRCKFCATGQLRRWRNLTAEEIVEQVLFVVSRNVESPQDAFEFKINYTRMGEPFLNLTEVQMAVAIIGGMWPGTHHYISTIGIKDSDFSWIKENITLQVSLHAMLESRRNWLIPWPDKMSIPELGNIRTASSQKTTLNLTLAEESDFDGEVLRRHFPPEHFFVKLSPINKNAVSERHALGPGAISGVNLR